MTAHHCLANPQDVPFLLTTGMLPALHWGLYNEALHRQWQVAVAASAVTHLQVSFRCPLERWAGIGGCKKFRNVLWPGRRLCIDSRLALAFSSRTTL